LMVSRASTWASTDFPEAGEAGVIPPETVNNLKSVGEYYLKLLDSDTLPGLHKGEHGTAKFIEAPREVRPAWRDKGYLDDQMVSDISNCDNAYMVQVETDKDHRFLRYLFCMENSKVRLVSAYRYSKDRWIRLKSKPTQADARIQRRTLQIFRSERSSRTFCIRLSTNMSLLRSYGMMQHVASPARGGIFVETDTPINLPSSVRSDISADC
jgi:hypothetical protein